MKKGALNFTRNFFGGLFCSCFTIPITDAKLKTSEIRSEIKYTSIRYPTETEI